jgi:hypothetical protein
MLPQAKADFCVNPNLLNDLLLVFSTAGQEIEQQQRRKVPLW